MVGGARSRDHNDAATPALTGCADAQIRKRSPCMHHVRAHAIGVELLICVHQQIMKDGDFVVSIHSRSKI